MPLQSMVFVRPLPEALKLSVYGKGWDLLGLALRPASKGVTIDLKDYAFRNFIVAKRLQYSLQQQLSPKLAITDIRPDTLFLQTESKKLKKVPVHLNVGISFKEHFAMGDEITFSPDSVVVSGPAVLIDSIKNIETERLSLANLAQVTTLDIPLAKPFQSNMIFSHKKVHVTIPVYALTEQVVEVPVEIINKKIKQEVKLIPSKIAISYQAPLNRYDQIKQSEFELVVDGSSIEASDGERRPLRLQLISKPPFVYNIRLKQEYVDYVLVR